VAALHQVERDLDAVDAAIARLDAGTYGLDPATGEPIDDARLAEDPTRLS
jgi:RNA polymerase-binding transcription factor DksA